jgi:hypothetical protein
MKPYAARTMGWLTGGARLPVGVVASEGEGAGSDEWGRRVSGARARVRSGRWAEGEGVAGARGGSGRGRGLDLAQLRGRRVSLFLFIFQNLYPFFILFF